MATSGQSGGGSDLRTGHVLAMGLTSAGLFASRYAAQDLGLAPLVFLAAFSPLPLMAARLRSASGAVLATVIAATCVGWLGSAGDSVVFLVGMAVPGLLVVEILTRGRGLMRGAFVASAWMVSVMTILLVANGRGLANQVLAALDDVRSPAFVAQMRSQGVSLEQVDAWTEQVATIYAALKVVYPAAFLIMGVSLVVLNAFMFRAYLARKDPGWLERGEFERLRWPLGLTLVFVLAGAGVSWPESRPLALNTLLLVGFLFGLQGLAIVAFLAGRLIPPLLLWLAGMMLILASPWLMYGLLALLGLADNWIDLRRWAEPPAAEGS
jgi:hypothetical protein